MRRKLWSILLSLCMVFSLLPVAAWAATASDFPDMPGRDNWAYAALSAAVENGLLQGSHGKLLPKDNLTRAQTAAILNRAFGAMDMADISTFTDVPASAWYAKDIAKAVRMGTFQGSGTKMYPDRAVTRQEAFTVLARAFKLTDGETSALDAFTDQAQVSGWAAPALAAMVTAGYVVGDGGALKPTSVITRAEFAQVMYRMISAYFNKSGTYTQTVSGNLMLNTPGITLKGVTVTGDLLIGEGVGDGEVTLDGVRVTGRIVVRGGGVNSIILTNQSSVGSILIGKTGDGGVRVRTEEGCHVDVVYVDDGKDDVILAGAFNQVAVQTDTPVVLRDATLTGLTISGEQAVVKLDGQTTVSAAEISGGSVGATLEVGEQASVATVSTAAEGVKIFGEGTVGAATVSGNNTAVDTKDTALTVAQGVTGVTRNGTAVAPTGDGDQTEITVTTSEQLVEAIQNTQYKKIWLGSRKSTEDQSFTIPASAGALTMGAGRELYVMENKYGNSSNISVYSTGTLDASAGTYDGVNPVTSGEGSYISPTQNP